MSADKGVECITQKGVVAGGVEYEVDCIIYATGFEITTSAHRRVDFDTVGEDDISLYEHWQNGFPHLAWIVGPQLSKLVHHRYQSKWFISQYDCHV